MTILARGAPLSGANGAMFGPDGLLYVASVGGTEIAAIDSETGEIRRRYTQAQGVDGPDDLAFGPDGSLYWTSLFSGVVGRLSPDGVNTGQMVAPGVNPITFSDDGRLFVALDFFGEGLYELDPGFRRPPRLLVKELGFLNAMDFGPDGLLYGPICTQGRIVCIDVNAQPATVTTVIDDLSIAIAVKFDSQGRLHAVDSGTGKVWRIDVTNGRKELVAQLQPGLDNLAFDRADRLFVTHAGTGAVWKVLPDGSNIELIPGGMIGPMGIAVVADGDGETVYTGNLFSLYAFDGATGAIRLAGVPAAAVSMAPFGPHLVAASWFDNTVTVLDPHTCAAVAVYRDFAVPLNAIEFQGDLVVAELGSGSVIRVHGEEIAERTTLAANLTAPLGLASGGGDLWVGDVDTGAIYQIATGGAVLPQPRPIIQGLAAPNGLALTADGRLLVLETGKGRLLSVNPITGETVTLAAKLSTTIVGPTSIPPVLLGVAVGPSGSIYVSGGVDKILYRINPSN
jgi:sugar lactone lactonase YvrE